MIGEAPKRAAPYEHLVFMSARWFLIGLGGPTLFGISLTIAIVGGTYETPCACGSPRASLSLHADQYRRKLATFDRAHGERMCPASLEQLEALPPFEAPFDWRSTGWWTEPFALECTISGAPSVRRIYLRHPDWDRKLDTSDDVLYRLD